MRGGHHVGRDGDLWQSTGACHAGVRGGHLNTTLHSGFVRHWDNATLRGPEQVTVCCGTRLRPELLLCPKNALRRFGWANWLGAAAIPSGGP